MGDKTLDAGCCAHLKVVWTTKWNTDGTETGWWECSLCRIRFMPTSLHEHLAYTERDVAIAAACAKMLEQAAQHCPLIKMDWEGHAMLTGECVCGKFGWDTRFGITPWLEHVKELPIPHMDALVRAKAGVAAFKAEVREYLEGLNVKIVGFESADGTSALLAGFDSLPADDSALARLIAKARLDALEEVDRRATKRRLLYAVALAEYHLELMQAHPELTGRAALTAEAEGKSLT